ncbi:ABC transporter ATP-binding protein (plasmid) [Ensifer adhaerens]|uniref:ABC transporter ATP-binding protein n=1 Tax=Ensifer adhaerens TaxID=106592 RepID=UPI0023A9913F|nr:ABC transporter ATP-binding protein [Ensifer adhaerens]WDZ79679.1 ABC transporter ATP-binding protein [Ensifer adhaerens]
MKNTTKSDRCAVDIRAVRKAYGAGENGFVALDSASVSVQENEFFTLLGPSGCGKTTLLRMIAGFDYPTNGEILLNGADITSLPPFKRPVNTVFQNYALFPHMTVAENVAFGLEALGKPRADVKARVAEMLRLVQLEHLAGRRTSQMSGGQQQRVALARALAPQPKVLLLDEPLSALDYKLRKEMQSELKRLQYETGITFIFVTHDQEEALTMSDRIAVMSAGRILQIGTPREIYNRPADRFVASFIGETNFLTGAVQGVANGKAKVTLKSGQSVVANIAPDAPASGDVTFIVRPEHASVVAGSAHLAGLVEKIVYFGTDTHLHLRLSGGEAFTVRQQNGSVSGSAVEVGQSVAVAIAEGAAQVVRA